jgi:hypothetical protein
MADWWDNVDLFFEFAPGDPPLTAVGSCTWVDISARVRSFSSKRGRSNELSTTSPGTATVVLDNRDSQLDPSYSSGTYYGELLPMRRFRVRATVGVTTATLFTGYVLGYPQSYPGMADSIVTVQLVDGFRVLEQAPLGATAYEAEVLADSPSHFWRLDTIDDDRRAAASVGGVDLDGTNPQPDYTTTYNPTVADVEFPVGQNSGVFGYSGVTVDAPSAPPKAIEGWINNPDSTEAVVMRAHYGPDDYIVVTPTPDGTSRAIYIDYSNTADNRNAFGQFVNFGFPLDSAPTHIAVTASASTIYLYLNGQEVWSTALSVGTFDQPDYDGVYFISQTETDTQALTNVAVYSTAPSATRIWEHYIAGLNAYGHPMGERGGARIGRILDSIGWPSADRDLSTGETVLDSWLPAEGTALSGCREVEATEQGLFFMSGDGKATFRDRQWFMTNTRAITVQATLGDDPGEIRYNDIDVDSNEATYIRNRVTCAYRSGSATVKDATSIAAYTEQADSVTASNLSSGWLARQLAAFRLRLRKDPATRIPHATINVRGGGGAAVNLAALIDLDLGDRVKAIRRPRDTVDPIETLAQLAGIDHKIERGGMWTIDTYLAPTVPSYTEGPYLTVGDATYGDIGVAAGNLVPY